MFDAYGEPVHIGLARTTDAADEWISRADAKAWLKLDDTADDVVVDSLIVAARNKVETDTRRGLLAQSWTLTLDRAPASGAPILFPINPVTSVTSVTSYSTADVSSVVATSVYRADTSSVPGRLVLKDGQSWPTDLRPQNGLVIVFVAGHGTAPEAIPTELVMAARLLMAHWYINREAVQIGTITSLNVPLGYESLISPYKVPWL